MIYLNSMNIEKEVLRTLEYLKGKDWVQKDKIKEALGFSDQQWSQIRQLAYKDLSYIEETSSNPRYRLTGAGHEKLREAEHNSNMIWLTFAGLFMTAAILCMTIYTINSEKEIKDLREEIRELENK